MEHLTAASSNDINGSYHMYKDHPHPSLLCNRTSEGTHKNIPLFHSNLHSSSIMCASQDVPAPQICAGRTPIEPFRRDGRDTLNVSSSSNIDALSSFHETSSGLHDNGIDESMRVQMQRAPSAHSSPEALLDVISTAQTKLRQLQAIAELLVQGGGQAQQQQSLVASMKSIMSQLYAATAGFYGQPAPANSALQLNRASIAQLSQALDLTFDDFPTNEMNSFTSSCLGSILGAASNEGFFSLSNTLPCSETTRSAMELVCVRSIHAVQMGPDLTRSAMEHTHIGGLGGSKPSGVKDPQLKKQRLNSSSPNPIRHNNTSNMPVENRVSNESPRVVVETCDNHGMYGNRSQEMFSLEDHDYASIFRDDDDEDVEGENLPPGSYELVEMAAAEILAEHTHFCEICGKGFKRDANLRMHMRGHGDEYKTPAALSRPDKYSQGPSKLRRYSCPYMGCKRNKKHRKFQPLKTTLCVKNHYRRSHCPKLLLCSKCKTKKFSVVADLKTHEKHCGQDKWLCSCGTTFSRKDKLVGHVSLFAGHTPALPIHEMEGLNEPAREGESGGSEGLSTSKPSYLTEVDSFSMSSENGQTFINTLMTENDNGMHIPDKSIMGKEVLMSDNYGQQKCPVTRVYPGEKSSLDNLKRGAMEVMQHCG